MVLPAVAVMVVENTIIDLDKHRRVPYKATLDKIQLIGFALFSSLVCESYSTCRVERLFLLAAAGQILV